MEKENWWYKLTCQLGRRPESPNTSKHNFTHALSVDKVTGMETWQVAVSQGWPTIGSLHNRLLCTTPSDPTRLIFRHF